MALTAAVLLMQRQDFDPQPLGRFKRLRRIEEECTVNRVVFDVYFRTYAPSMPNVGFESVQNPRVRVTVERLDEPGEPTGWGSGAAQVWQGDRLMADEPFWAMEYEDDANRHIRFNSR